MRSSLFDDCQMVAPIPFLAVVPHERTLNGVKGKTLWGKWQPMGEQLFYSVFSIMQLLVMPKVAPWFLAYAWVWV